MHQDKSGSNRKKAFTLVEVLVALGILSVSLTPVFAQIAASFRVSRVIERNLTAVMLAQEGIELVRGIRDDNWFAEVLFDTDLDGCDSGCRIQIVDDLDDQVLLPLGTNPPLKLDPQYNRYQYDDGPNSIYSREITVTEVIPDVQLRVTSKVSWTTPTGGSNDVTIEGHLFDWLNL